MPYELRPVRPNEVEAALRMALDVFICFDAPAYPAQSVEEFRRNILENPFYKRKCQLGISPLYGAFDGGEPVGIIGLRENKTHISLLFTRRDHHRRGLATALIDLVIAQLRREKPEQRLITLTAAPYGDPFYRNLGFHALPGNGRATPMWYQIPGESK